MRTVAMLALAVLCAAWSMIVPAAAEERFPTKPVRLIVPFPAGGPTDIVARLVAANMRDELGENVIVENRAGATGTIGSGVVAKSDPDGYTMVMGTLGSHTLAPLLAAKRPYDPTKDFAPVSLLAIVPNVLMVHPSIPAKTVPELVKLLKENPGRYNYGSAGNGSPLHLSGVLFQRVTGVDIVHVPYRGSAPALQDLRGGQLALMFDAIPSALPIVTSGDVRGLAVTGPKRVSSLPDLPTMVEAGIADFESYTWNALFVRAGTPASIITRLNEAAVAAVRKPEVAKRLAELGADVVGSSPGELGSLVAKEMDKWGPVIEASGARQR